MSSNLSSIQSSIKIFQRWGLDLLACSFILFFLGIIVIIIGATAGENRACQGSGENSSFSGNPPTTGSHDSLAEFYSQQLGYKVSITNTFSFCRCRPTDRCPGETHGCTGCTPGHYHWGYDFSIKKGDPVVAAYPGKIIYLDEKTPGVFVESENKDHVVIYNHININPGLYVGMPVKVGTLLGTVNSADHLDVKKTTNWRHWGCGAFDW